MKDSVKERIALVRESDDNEHLRRHLCPFYELGSFPKCPSCKKTDADLAECKEVYLTRIGVTPMDVWSSDFDNFHVEIREKIPFKEVSGIGINCDTCYMFDKCPMYKGGFSCAIDWTEGLPEKAEDFYDFLVDSQYERVRRATVFEKADGGVPDAGLSGEMDRLQAFVDGKANLSRERFSLNVEATGASNSGGGILAKLFGGGNKELPEKSENVIPIKNNDEIQEAEYVDAEEEIEKLQKEMEMEEQRKRQ